MCLRRHISKEMRKVCQPWQLDTLVWCAVSSTMIARAPFPWAAHTGFAQVRAKASSLPAYQRITSGTRHARQTISLHRGELESVEEAYMRSRKAHLEQCQAEMQQMFETRTNLEAEFTERYLAMVENYQKQLFDLQISDAQVLAACGVAAFCALLLLRTNLLAWPCVPFATWKRGEGTS